MSDTPRTDRAEKNACDDAGTLCCPEIMWDLCKTLEREVTIRNKMLDLIKSTSPTGTEAQVCLDIADRQKRGVAKYGMTVEDNPLTHLEWLRHAYEEALDLAIYLRRAMDTRSIGGGTK